MHVLSYVSDFFVMAFVLGRYYVELWGEMKVSSRTRSRRILRRNMLRALARDYYELGDEITASLRT